MKNFKSKIINFQKGFTLIEVIVSMGMMLIIIGTLSAIFVSALRIQRYNLAYQDMLNQTSYMMEYMSRAIRMAQKDATVNNCVDDGQNYKFENNELKFVNYEGDCQSFKKEVIGGVPSITTSSKGPANTLTSSNLTVNNFSVQINNDESGKQPSVTIFFDISGRESTRLKIQTTVSERNLNI